MSDSDQSSQRLGQKSTATQSTFETHGVSEEEVLKYLKTSEGKLFWQKLANADHNASIDEINDRAIRQIRSGRELPQLETI